METESRLGIVQVTDMEMGVAANKYRISLRGEENILELDSGYICTAKLYTLRE